MSKNKIIIRIIIIILIIAVLFNAVWFINYFFVYSKYKKAVEYDKEIKSYILNKDGYTYGVKAPTYPQFVGNLYITKNWGKKNNEKTYCSDILIWPSLIGKNEIQITINKINWTQFSEGVIGIASFNVDENMNLIGDYSQSDKKIFEEHMDVIKESWEKAHKVFDLT